MDGGRAKLSQKRSKSIANKNKVEEEIKNTLVSLTKKVGESRTLREEEDLENAKKGRAEKKKSITTQKEEKNLKN